MAQTSLSSYVGAIVAALQLSEVSMITQAIRTADLSAGGAVAGGPLGVVVRPDAAAIFEPTTSPNPADGAGQSSAIYTAQTIRKGAPAEREMKTRPEALPEKCGDGSVPKILHTLPSPIQPPWKVLPWPHTNSACASKVIKLLIAPPDNNRSGTILDCFI